MKCNIRIPSLLWVGACGVVNRCFAFGFLTLHHSGAHSFLSFFEDKSRSASVFSNLLVVVFQDNFVFTFNENWCAHSCLLCILVAKHTDPCYRLPVHTKCPTSAREYRKITACHFEKKPTYSNSLKKWDFEINFLAKETCFTRLQCRAMH